MRMPPGQGDSPPAALDERGSAFIEYLILVAMFSVVVAITILQLGDPLLRFFRNLQLIWSSPFP